MGIKIKMTFTDTSSVFFAPVDWEFHRKYRTVLAQVLYSTTNYNFCTSSPRGTVIFGHLSPDSVNRSKYLGDSQHQQTNNQYIPMSSLGCIFQFEPLSGVPVPSY